MKNIIVTGGAGYIGSHTCKLLSSFGYQPIVYDNLSEGNSSAVKWGPLIHGELHDTHKLIETLKQFQPLAIIHFAASAYVGESVKNPFKYYKNNVGGTLSLLEAMRITAIDKIVFSSTCATYGIPKTTLISEECYQSPINPYGQSKLIIEKILGDLSKSGDIKQISLRYFNAAGADKNGDIGENHNPETHLIPLAISSANGGGPLYVFGTDFSTPDGTAVRDYIHVEDLAKAHILAVEHLLVGGASDYINLGTGKGTSVREIINTLKDLGIEVWSIDSARRLGDPDFLVCNPQRAYEILKWRAEYGNIVEILQSAIKWHLQKVNT